MKPDPKAEAQRWLQRARTDLDDAEVLAKAGSHASACFHAQQSAEKSLKAMLIGITGDPPPHTHSVSQLLGTLSQHTDVPEQLSETMALDSYYIPTRYPDGLPAGALAEEVYKEPQSSSAMALAQSVLRFAEEEI
jgi:HEPN domain-containing protein